jgi:hypothetical protein
VLGHSARGVPGAARGGTHMTARTGFAKAFAAAAVGAGLKAAAPGAVNAPGAAFRGSTLTERIQLQPAAGVLLVQVARFSATIRRTSAPEMVSRAISSAAMLSSASRVALNASVVAA